VSAPAAGLRPLQASVSLQDQAYEAIKDSILRLVFAPGTILYETELASQLGTSKTPVREALQRLAQEHWVKIIPHKGAMIGEISVTDVRELTEIRAALVALAAELTAERISEAGVEAPTRMLTEADKALATRDMELWLELNERFHNWVLASSGNDTLCQMLSHIDQQFARIQRLAAGVPGGLEESSRGHYEILTALAAHDPARAAAAARSHIVSIGEQCLQRMEAAGIGESPPAVPPAGRRYRR
jgi:DNA-binding GntR family transcriptional regulator